MLRSNFSLPCGSESVMQENYHEIGPQPAPHFTGIKRNAKPLSRGNNTTQTANYFHRKKETALLR